MLISAVFGQIVVIDSHFFFNTRRRVLCIASDNCVVSGWLPISKMYSYKIYARCQRGFMAKSLAPPLHKDPDPGIQGCRRSHPPVRCRDLGSLTEADQATGAVSPTLLALHPWHQMARLRVKRISLQNSQPEEKTSAAAFRVQLETHWLMTAVAAVAAFLMDKVPRRGCAVSYTRDHKYHCM